MDQTIESRGDSVRLRNGPAVTTRRATGPAYPQPSYAPAAARAGLVRYWLRRGRPDALPLLPSGVARLRVSGVDTVAGSGGPTPLRRLTMTGVVWGVETAWVDPADHLVALVTRVVLVVAAGRRYAPAPLWRSVEFTP